MALRLCPGNRTVHRCCSSCQQLVAVHQRSHCNSQPVQLSSSCGASTRHRDSELRITMHSLNCARRIFQRGYKIPLLARLNSLKRVRCVVVACGDAAGRRPLRLSIPNGATLSSAHPSGYGIMQGSCTTPLASRGACKPSVRIR